MCNEFKNDMTIEEAEARCAELADKYEAACRYADELKRQRDEEKRTELKAQRAKRQEEIDAVRTHLVQLIKDFYQDYGYYYVTHKSDDYPIISKLFDFFAF